MPTRKTTTQETVMVNGVLIPFRELKRYYKQFKVTDNLHDRFYFTDDRQHAENMYRSWVRGECFPSLCSRLQPRKNGANWVVLADADRSRVCSLCEAILPRRQVCAYCETNIPLRPYPATMTQTEREDEIFSLCDKLETTVEVLADRVARIIRRPVFDMELGRPAHLARFCNYENPPKTGVIEGLVNIMEEAKGIEV